MQEGLFLLRLQGGSASATELRFATREEARKVADEQWWMVDARVSRQWITDESTGEIEVRRSDGSWTQESPAVRPKAGETDSATHIDDRPTVIDLRGAGDPRPQRGSGWRLGLHRSR